MRRPALANAAAICLMLALSVAAAASAEPNAAGEGAGSVGEALSWLQKVPAAAKQLSYSGTFVYQNGQRSETSRIVHIATGEDQFEKLEVLDGSPREVVRHNDEVKCYLPEKRLLVIERRGTRTTFPSLLPASLSGLTQNYQLRKGASVRVAGRESQLIKLEPRDEWRFARQFWIDQEKGLLLKAETLGVQGESLETLSFTEVMMGAPAGVDAAKSSFASAPQRMQDWQVRQARLQELRDDQPWQFRAALPGFRRQTALLRSVALAGGKVKEVRHWVFSDGLAAVSVFITPAEAPVDGQGSPQSQPKTSTAPAEDEIRVLGATAVLERTVEGHQLTVMGDVPVAAIRHFANGIGVRGK